MARFEDDDEELRRPRRGRRRDDDDEGDFEEPPRRRSRRRRLNWIEQQFADTAMVLLILFPLCVAEPALVLSILGVILCKDSTARRNAIIVLCLSIARIALAAILTVVFVLNR